MRHTSLTIFLAVVLVTLCLGSQLLVAQSMLYDNGPDGDTGYYAVNFGSALSNSFHLARPATLTSVVLTIYDVNERNYPGRLQWSITTQPFGGVVIDTGSALLARLQSPYLTRFLFFAWEMSFQLPSIKLPAGTYYLQIQNVTTRWHTWAFWAQSSGGDSQAYYEAVEPGAAPSITPVPSETFQVIGEWAD